MLCFLAIGMPNLNLLMSMAIILLTILWLFAPGFKLGWKVFLSNRIAVLLAGLFLIHVIWLFNTTDFTYALKDLRIKLPMLVLAVVLGSVPISRNQMKIFFLALSAGVWIATLPGYIRYSNLPEHFHDYRDIVVGISHIRLSLLMVMLVIGVIYFWKEMSPFWKGYGLLVIVNTFIFFNILQSATGFLVLIFSLWFAAVYKLWKKPRKYLALYFVATLIVMAALGYSSYIYYQSYFVPKQLDAKLEATTAQGNPYQHHKELKLVENGNYTFNYICPMEMKEAWNSRSNLKIPIDSPLTKQESILIRYLTYDGLRKDYNGVMQLTDTDIKNIENGYPTEVYARESGLVLRFHTFMFGLHVYITSGDASGLSFFQRIVYWKVSTYIIKKNFWLGTGTGDVKQAFYDAHQELNPNLPQRYWLRSHNQFLTFFAAFGILGFLYFLYLFGYALYRRKADYLAVAFLLVAFISCLTEDTVESQAGVTFFMVFFALLSKPLIFDSKTNRTLK